MTNRYLFAILYSYPRGTQHYNTREITTMTFTYKTYLLNKDLVKYQKDIQIVEVVDKMDLGAIVRFTCTNSAVLDEIFGEDDF